MRHVQELDRRSHQMEGDAGLDSCRENPSGQVADRRAPGVTGLATAEQALDLCAELGTDGGHARSTRESRLDARVELHPPAERRDAELAVAAHDEAPGPSEGSLGSTGGDPVGAEVLVIKEGRTIFHETFGWKDREREIPMEKHSIARIRSMTKPFVGTSILMLREKGELALDDPVSKYIPAWDTDVCRDIRIEQLLTHTAGFSQPGYPTGLTSFANLRDLVDAIGAAGPQMTPGEQYKLQSIPRWESVVLDRGVPRIITGILTATSMRPTTPRR